MNKAIEQFNRGNIKFSKELILKSLEIKSRNADAYNILGIINAMQGDLTEAIICLKKTIRIEKNNYFAHYNLGKVYIEKNDFFNAIVHCEKSTELQPKNSEAWLNFGIVQLNLGEYDKSLEYFNIAINLNPKYIEAFINKGVALNHLRKYEDAIFSFDNAISLEPRCAEAYFNKASVLLEIKSLNEAYKNFEISSAIHKNPFESLFQMGYILYMLKNYKESINIIEKALVFDEANIRLLLIKGRCLTEIMDYRKAVEIFESILKYDGKNVEANINLARVHYRSNNLNEAMNRYEMVLKSDEYNLIAYTGKGLIYRDMGHYDKSFENYAKAKQIDPNYPEVNYFEGLLNLELKNFEIGWNGYAYRWDITEINQKFLTTNKKIWSGEKGVIYIWTEQGVGDQILYTSIFNDFNYNDNKFIIKIDSRLLDIYIRSFPKIKFIGENDNINEDHYDYHCPIGDLGRIYRSALSKFSNVAVPYLYSKNVIFDEIEELKEKNKLICGVAWRSSNVNDGHFKSIDLTTLIKSIADNRFEFVSLQYGNTKDDLLALEKNLKHKITSFEHVDLKNDFESVCLIINSCDVVLTVSNSVAHLCGALGKETILLIPKGRGKFWYWSEIKGRSLFYKNMTVISQHEDGNWDEALTQVGSMLRSY